MLGDLSDNGFLNYPMLTSVEELLNRQTLLDDLHGKLAEVATLLAGQRASLKVQHEAAERAIRRSRRPAITAAVIYEETEKLTEVERNASRQLRPILEKLTAALDKLGDPDAEDRIGRTVKRYVEDAMDIIVCWLELIQNHRLNLLRLASEKGTAQAVISTQDELDRELASLSEDAD